MKTMMQFGYLLFQDLVTSSLLLLDWFWWTALDEESSGSSVMQDLC